MEEKSKNYQDDWCVSLSLPWKDPGDFMAWSHHEWQVMTRSGQAALHDIGATRRRFIGHILRLPPTRLAGLFIKWRYEDGKRNTARPKKTCQNIKRKSGGNGHRLERQDDCCQRSCQLETKRRPMFRTELGELSLSKSTGCFIKGTLFLFFITQSNVDFLIWNFYQL